MPLPLFELPLQSGAPPPGFSCESHSSSDLSSTTTTFETILCQRDKFFGLPACVICGDDRFVNYCHIIPEKESATWKDLKSRGWIPQTAKDPAHEPRNGLVMCPNHNAEFSTYQFMIRFSPETERFILINYSNRRLLKKHHGKAIALDKRDRYVSFASLFIIHEWRVRGCNPFQPLAPTIPAKILWQDWIKFDKKSGFQRDTPPASPRRKDVSRLPPQRQSLPASTSGAGASTQILPALDNDFIAEILAITRSLPTWKACELENTSWDGTAEENTKKYLDKSGGGFEEHTAVCHKAPSGKLGPVRRSARVKTQVEDSHAKQLGESYKGIGKRKRTN